MTLDPEDLLDPLDPRDPRDPRMSSKKLFFCCYLPHLRALTLQNLSSLPLAKAWPRRCTKTAQGAPKGSHSCPKTAKATPIMIKSDLKWTWNDLSIPGEHFPGVELRSEAIGGGHLGWGCYIWKVFRRDVQKSILRGKHVKT